MLSYLLRSVHFILAQSGTSIEFTPLSFLLPLSSSVIQSAQVIIYGNQKHNYLNSIKAEQLMVGKKLLVSTSLINPFGTSIIDQHFQESIKLTGFCHFFLQGE